MNSIAKLLKDSVTFLQWSRNLSCAVLGNIVMNYWILSRVPVFVLVIGIVILASGGYWQAVDLLVKFTALIFSLTISFDLKVDEQEGQKRLLLFKSLSEEGKSRIVKAQMYFGFTCAGLIFFVLLIDLFSLLFF